MFYTKWITGAIKKCKNTHTSTLILIQTYTLIHTYTHTHPYTHKWTKNQKVLLSYSSTVWKKWGDLCKPAVYYYSLTLLESHAFKSVEVRGSDNVTYRLWTLAETYYIPYVRLYTLFTHSCPTTNGSIIKENAPEFVPIGLIVFPTPDTVGPPVYLHILVLTSLPTHLIQRNN